MVWIHGAYGTGKSQCAYALKSILEVPEDELKAYWDSYDALKKENDDNYTRIMTSVDLDYIRDVAINELGMVYANEDQVILYDGGTKDYVRQSQDVPKDSKNSLMDQLLGKNGK